MFLTTAASASSSIAIISQVLTTTTNNNISSTTSTPTIRSKSTKEQQGRSSNQNSKQSVSTITSNSNKKKEKRQPLPRTNTSSSVATSSSTATTSSHATTDSSTYSRYSTSASSIYTTPSSPAERHLSAISQQFTAEEAEYFPEEPASVDAAVATTASAVNNDSVTSPSTIHQEGSRSTTHLAATTNQYRNSMRRRATDSISGSNLIPTSLRAVFRDNTTTAAVNADESTATTEQPTDPQRNSASPPQARNLSHMTRNISYSNTAAAGASSSSSNQATSNNLTNGNAPEMPSIKFIPHQDQRTARPSLAFAPTTRTLPEESSIIRVGRYSERDVSPNANNMPSAAPIGFKSKVVSRRHCEFWCVSGQWYVKDVKSSSGTFLNHIRLSQPSTESKPFPVNDGDIIQLGMDFRGGEESIFRCVKIRIEVNRGWQKKLNDFNTTTHKALRALSKETGPTSSTECSICLMSIAPCQALFVAPCSHVWHYKCIRPVINNPKMYPQFLCPNCRAVADLDADIEEHIDGWDETEDLVGNDGVLGEQTGNRFGTPINGHRTGDDSNNVSMTEDPSIVIQPPVPVSDSVQLNSNNNSGISNTELQDTTILFSETSPIEIRDPRVISDTLEGVVTPRNEAGPFVFDGTGRRVQAPQPA